MHMQSDFYMREFSIESKLKTSIDKYLFPETHGKHRIDFDQSKVTTFIFFIQLGPNGVHFWIKHESTRRTFRHGTCGTAHTEAKPKPGRERAAGRCKSPQWCRRRPPPPHPLSLFLGKQDYNEPPIWMKCDVTILRKGEIIHRISWTLNKMLSDIWLYSCRNTCNFLWKTTRAIPYKITLHSYQLLFLTLTAAEQRNGIFLMLFWEITPAWIIFDRF